MADLPLAETARRLIRRTRAAVLATSLPAAGTDLGTGPGMPFASLVTQAPAPDLAPLLWLSLLARHTQNLDRDPRCSLLVAGPPVSPNPQTAPRVTLIGTAARAADPALLARWHALNPYAAPYAGLTDFSLWRLSITAAHVVGGFAAAAELNPTRLVPDQAAVAALAKVEPEILAHCNSEHAAAIDAIAGAAGGAGTGWRVVAVDPDGCDLVRGEAVLRIDFAAPVRSAGGVHTQLICLARGARESLAKSAVSRAAAG
ncbi:MAG: DUF2470 domain-containing protein [Rhodospirillales bacterium]|nr:DUF2470 domain-containing protein [Rhodospirillales bacterium]